jgi:Zn-dependent peptidase ImmA (M78 family)/DNA-binding XRE family transcriptional regulator
MANTFNPGMLQVARQLRAKSQQDLAEAAGISQAKLSKIENGLVQPDDSVAAKLAGALTLPLSFFAHSERVFGLPLSVHQYFRKRASAGTRVLDQLQAELNLRIMHVRRIMQAVDIHAEYELPALDLEDFENSPTAVAAAVRRAWLIPSGPIPSLVDVIERAGCIVIPSHFKSGAVDGVSLRVPALPGMIFINAAQSVDRQRFSLAHELGHLVMHRQPTPNLEEEADEFAAAFLMPRKDIAGELSGPLTLERLAFLKPIWRSSMGSLLYRAKKLGFISDNQSQYLWRQMSMAGYRKIEPVEISAEPDRPKLLNTMIQYHLKTLRYTIDDLSQALHVLPGELLELYGMADSPQSRQHLRVIK